jgi:ribosome-associated protein
MGRAIRSPRPRFAGNRGFPRRLETVSVPLHVGWTGICRGVGKETKLTSATLSSGTAKRAATRAKRPTAVPDALKTILKSLDDSKAEDIVSIDIAGKSSIGDTMVVSSGRSHRHVGAIAERLVEDLKAAGENGVKVEGLAQCDWVLIDTGDIIVHVFRPEVRGFYNLEKMWQADTPGVQATA